MVQAHIPDPRTLVDEQVITIQGHDGASTTYIYDLETQTLTYKDSNIVIPPFHGQTHVTSDPVPDATTDLHGLMSADDKARLDALIQTRIGVLGFIGSGFPDDQGWLQGDIILAAGTEFINLERVGNVVRFTVDSAVPLGCCFVPGAPVHMADGTTKPIENVQIGDLVVTHSGDVRRVSALKRNPWNGDIYDISVIGREGLAVTGYHPILAAGVVSAVRNKALRDVGLLHDEFHWVRADSLQVGDKVALRGASTHVVEVKSIDFSGPSATLSEGMIYPTRSDGFVDGMASGIPQSVEVNADLMRLLGIYVAEGCYSDKNGIRFTVHEKEMHGGIGSDVIRLMRDIFKLEPKIYKRGLAKACDIKFSSKILGHKLLEWFGKGANKKSVPDWIMSLDPALQYYFLLGVLQGDGYVQKQENPFIALHLASERLISQLAAICDRLGYNFQTPGGKRNSAGPAARKAGRKAGNYAYRLTLNGSHCPELLRDLSGIQISSQTDIRTGTVRSVEKRHYDGIVYNLEVEKDRSYVVNGIAVHNCEECANIFWLQDPSDVAAIMPPSCGGKLPGVNEYGELKIFAMPETTIFDPSKPLDTLNKKGRYPTLQFRRSTDQLQAGAAELEIVLKRRTNYTTQVGWAMTPTPTKAVCAWWMGDDSLGNQIRFDLDAQTEPGMLGALLYKGHTLTRRMAVVTSYSPSVIATNQYNVKYWDVLKAEPIGSAFVATNIWKYQNPENSPTANTNPRTLTLDATGALLDIGTLVQLWEFKIAEVSGQPIYRRYFNLQPQLSADVLWNLTGAIRFGDLLTARKENEHGSDPTTGVRTDVSDLTTIERTIWGLKGYPDILLLSDDLLDSSGPNPDPSGVQINDQYMADIDPTLPGLKVIEPIPTASYPSRPVFLWHRLAHKNHYLKALIGQPDSSKFPPIDILLKAPVESTTDMYGKIIRRGTITKGPFTNGHFIIAKGVCWKDLPQSGAVRIMTGNYRNTIWDFYAKTAFSNYDDDAVVLIGNDTFPFSEDSGSAGPGSGSGGGSDTPLSTTVVEILHQDFNAPAVRLEFSINPTSGDETVQLRFVVGTLDMAVPYELNLSGNPDDDFVRGFTPGYMVSRVYTQSGFITANEAPAADPEGFKCYAGGFLPYEIDGQLERWNVFEAMFRDGQLWLWWNNLLIPPSALDSAELPTPVVVNTPYFPLTSQLDIGKTALRLWPGAKIRAVEVRDQGMRFSEFSHGQLELR